MLKLIQTFTFDRNAFKRSALLSAKSAADHIALVTSSASLDKTQANIVGAFASYMGLFAREGEKFKITEAANAFLRMYSRNESDAWRWLATRSLWRFVIPNGTACAANAVAKANNTSFAFFYNLLGLLMHLGTLSDDRRFLYYDEFLKILDDDAKWKLGPADLFSQILSVRSSFWRPITGRQTLLEDLEDQYKVGRDNFNTLFNKSFDQTGLFSFVNNGPKIVGLGLSTNLDAVLQRRIRFMLDNPPIWKHDEESWPQFLELHEKDLPQAVSTSEVSAVPVPESSVKGMVEAAFGSFRAANFIVSQDLLVRFISSLLAKRLVILTGLSGSGKTKLAQAFAVWLGGTQTVVDSFEPGAEIKSDKISYHVAASDDLAIELWNHKEEAQATKVVLPRALVLEWVAEIREKGFDKDTTARTIREAVDKKTKYSTQLNSFETHLKAAAFRYIEFGKEPAAHTFFELIAVGPDWNGKENVLGYPDALNSEKYVRTPTLDLLLRAKDDPTSPYFLILDEMNLSHVERYFADMLSSMESGQPIHLHDDLDAQGKPTMRDGVPGEVRFPHNVFVIGTVNVDETTYMFSPKVLDRANVIEFRVDGNELLGFAERPSDIELDSLRAVGFGFSSPFLQASQCDPQLEVSQRQMLKAEIDLLFHTLSQHNAEFGFRVVHEMARFSYFYEHLSGESETFRDAWDSQILQKVLPKLHGSRRKLEPILLALSAYCYMEHKWSTGGEVASLSNKGELEKGIAEATQMQGISPLSEDSGGNRKYPTTSAHLSRSYEKIARMLSVLDQNGFASFAEA
ncbi:MAG TPA: hypothetical protein VNE63_12115 [Candidatus Acidoferrales bacterium]|nr:hypothetical protein [Candidatus Acidoferrales bacterium]